MNKFFYNTVIIGLLLVTSVSANSNMQALLKAKKAQAIALYKQGSYESAYQMLTELYMSALSDSKINFILGRSAYETGRYEIALAAFERVQILDPANARNQLEIARTQYVLKMYEDARLGLKEVLANPSLPGNVRTNVELLLSKVDKELRKSFFYGTVKIGGIYDSNVNYGAYDDRYNLPSYGTFSTTKPVSDYARDLQVGLTHIYDIGEKNGYTVRNSVTAFNREYTSEHDYDMTYLSYSPALVYQDLKSTYEVNVMFDHMLLNHASYLNVYSLMPNVIYKPDATTYLSTYVKFARKNFTNPTNELRDARNFEASLGIQKFYGSSYFSLKTTIEEERKLKGKLIDVDYMRKRINVDYTRQFSQTYTGKVELEINNRKFKDPSTLFQNTRLDQGYKSGVSMTKKFTPTIYLEAKATYERNWSNQAVYAYAKHTYNVALNKSF